MRISWNLRCRSGTVFLATLAALLAAPYAQGQLGGRVPDWQPPSNFTLRGPSEGGSRTALTTMGDIGNEIGFQPVTPCRIVDTRGPAGTFGAPSLSPGSPRSFPLPTGPCAGIPTGVGAYSLNVTATNTQGPGFFKIYPQGGVAPVVSTLNYVGGQTVANAAIVPAGATGGITVAAGVSGADLVIDINGYYSQALNPLNYFSVVTSYSAGGGVIFGENLDTTNVGNGGHFITKSPMDGSAGVEASADATSGVTSGILGETKSTTDQASGVQGVVLSSTPGGFSAGVLGVNNSTSGNGMGVMGTHSGSGWGVYGTSPTGFGTYGFSPLGVGAVGSASSGVGVYGSTNAITGSVMAIWGQAFGTTGTIPGIVGETFSASPAAFGVVGRVNGPTPGGFSTGVRGISLGTSGQGIGVWGSHPAGGYGVFGTAPAGVGIAVYAGGDLLVSGAKSFVEPHPTDAGKEIRYVALEGPESGTYFRGRGTFQNGLAIIEVPENFRLVTDSEGLSVQVTPIGAMATVAVLRIDLEKIVVQASRSVDFFYMVNGVRKSEKSFEPIHEAKIFAPQGPEAQLPEWLTAEQKKML